MAGGSSVYGIWDMCTCTQRTASRENMNILFDRTGRCPARPPFSPSRVPLWPPWIVPTVAVALCASVTVVEHCVAAYGVGGPKNHADLCTFPRGFCGGSGQSCRPELSCNPARYVDAADPPRPPPHKFAGREAATHRDSRQPPTSNPAPNGNHALLLPMWRSQPSSTLGGAGRCRSDTVRTTDILLATALAPPVDPQVAVT